MRTFKQFLKEAKIDSFSNNLMLETFGEDLPIKVVDNFNDVAIRLGNKNYKITDEDFIHPLKKMNGVSISKLSDKEVTKLAEDWERKLEKEEKDIRDEIMKVAKKFDDEIVKIIKKHKGKI